MKRDEIIKHIKNKIPKAQWRDVKAVTMRETKGWFTFVMLSYSGGDGLGYIGASTFLDIQYNSRESADKTTELINKTFKKYDTY